MTGKSCYNSGNMRLCAVFSITPGPPYSSGFAKSSEHKGGNQPGRMSSLGSPSKDLGDEELLNAGKWGYITKASENGREGTHRARAERGFIQ
ncbi:Hypothetical protein NTJ_07608 [Nesidiocoris tenuis]|uniref:Uncharacterized protein n=1 Tax=Nesidiocoris tenuis TaxID=355587 RepID=A0ABN7AU24_9HEMI|nr:Hypothetical protein NTJ_07608 [Nesidiocoris tenuis]